MVEQRKSTAERDGGSSFARPGFVVAAVLVLVVVLLGVIAAVRIGRSDDVSAPPATSTSPTTTQAPTGASADPSASVCGLPGSVDEATLTAAPATAWEYDDTTAYPSSPEFGPGRTASEGYRYCFQHTPTGAVFATANALAQGASSDLGKRSGGVRIHGLRARVARRGLEAQQRRPSAVQLRDDSGHRRLYPLEGVDRRVLAF